MDASGAGKALLGHSLCLNNKNTSSWQDPTGKTTLLIVLANRASASMVSGEKIVDARYEDEGFARKVGYTQQQDVHLFKTTVREALIFSARLRQPKKYTDTEKLAYVDEVIDILDLSKLANAVIGTPGEGLNVEQRKRVTIGVELAARPELLLFLDEPTSGLNSDTAWSIRQLLRKLADNGHAILCTIHQPSATIFQTFDRLYHDAVFSRCCCLGLFVGDDQADIHSKIGVFPGPCTFRSRAHPTLLLSSFFKNQLQIQYGFNCGSACRSSFARVT